MKNTYFVENYVHIVITFSFIPSFHASTVSSTLIRTTQLCESPSAQFVQSLVDLHAHDAEGVEFLVLYVSQTEYGEWNV